MHLIFRKYFFSFDTNIIYAVGTIEVVTVQNFSFQRVPRPRKHPDFQNKVNKAKTYDGRPFLKKGRASYLMTLVNDDSELSLLAKAWNSCCYPNPVLESSSLSPGYLQEFLSRF